MTTQIDKSSTELNAGFVCPSACREMLVAKAKLLILQSFGHGIKQGLQMNGGEFAIAPLKRASLTPSHCNSYPELRTEIALLQPYKMEMAWG